MTHSKLPKLDRSALRDYAGKFGERVPSLIRRSADDLGLLVDLASDLRNRINNNEPVMDWDAYAEGLLRLSKEGRPGPLIAEKLTRAQIDALRKDKKDTIAYAHKAFQKKT